jgi:signal transduction histidine kinase
MPERVERGLRPGWHRSIFVKLLAIMLATAAIITAAVALVFQLLVVPSMDNSRRLIAEYTRTLAATAPDRATAERLAAELELKIRYEGPDGVWTTSPDLPAIRDVEDRSGRYGLYLAPGGRGGTYLVASQFGRRLLAAHNQMVHLTLLFVVVVLFIAWAILRRSLRPVRLLYEGVTRLGEGHLDVQVPRRTRDELGALTDAFNRMVRRIGEMLRARDQLLLDVSHELRSPLTRMKVALALLPESDDKHKRIAADVAEMEMMITELLELERLREGGGIRTGRHDLLPILREMAESFADRPPGVCVVSPASGIPLDIDAERIRTVLRNLLENAIKYSLPESGPVEISVEQHPDTVVVRVTDDGPGIPEADLPNLFEPFFRVDRSRSKKSGGYGLGLSICKRILEAHRGTITAENNVGRRGATFMLTLRKGLPSPGPSTSSL